VKEQPKSIGQEIEEMSKYWNELIFMVCKGDATAIREVIKFDIFDFFGFVENYRKGNKK
jgi:hypothetical protein